MLGHPVEWTDNDNLTHGNPILQGLVSHAGIQAARLSGLMRDVVPPGITAAVVIRMADYLEVSVGWLLVEEEPMTVIEAAKTQARIRRTPITKFIEEPAGPATPDRATRRERQTPTDR
jgi:hypothetical protein